MNRPTPGFLSNGRAVKIDPVHIILTVGNPRCRDNYLVTGVWNCNQNSSPALSLLCLY
ncbi:MAG: hypothetical protein IPO22_16065 [Anaerolineales bacterium]|nr:hypothetical protein [Anaerolineales bacterium]